MRNACTSCGACCAHFRVSFHWSESDAHPAGRVPQALTERVTPHLVAMRGTTTRPVRCVGLRGEVGQSVTCGLYAQRSSTCRELQPGDPGCLQARAHHGLPPLPGPFTAPPA